VRRRVWTGEHEVHLAGEAQVDRGAGGAGGAGHRAGGGDQFGDGGGFVVESRNRAPTLPDTHSAVGGRAWWISSAARSGSRVIRWARV
jgi:hypothetical protein